MSSYILNGSMPSPPEFSQQEPSSCNDDMKIRKIKYNNHPVIGNLELDLVNPNTGLPYDTIVFAGENGTGKTTILSTLNAFLCLGPFEAFERIEYEVGGHLYAVVSAGTEHANKMGFHHRIDLQTNTTSNIQRNRNNDRDGIARDNLDLRHYGCVYSKARADFSVRKLSHRYSTFLPPLILSKL